MRQTAACRFTSIGPAAKAAIPTLESLLRDDDDSVRRHAQAALKSINRNVKKKN